MALSCVGGGAAIGAEASPPRAPVKPGGRLRVYDSARININTASRSELTRLEGVSNATAQRIIAYREAHGRFKRLHDLRRVDGVSKAVVEMNAGRMTVK